MSRDHSLRLACQLGPKNAPNQGAFILFLLGDHLGMILDFEKLECRAPTGKLRNIVILTKALFAERPFTSTGRV